MTKIVLISGSHRANSESGRVADYLASRLSSVHGVTADVMKLDGNPLPLWDDSAWNPELDLAKQFAPYATRLAAADGFVVIAPEWAGMAAPAVKNFMLYTDVENVGHKPALIVSVSSGNNGVYPVVDLHVTSYKNNRIVYIPEHLIVRNVGSVFKGDVASGPDDEYIRSRTDYALGVLKKYAVAMATMRSSGSMMDDRYPYGM